MRSDDTFHFPNFIEELGPPLLLYARSLTPAQPHDPCDLVQEALVRFIRLDDLPEDPRGWLYRTVRNLAFTSHRRATVAAKANAGIRFERSAGVAPDAEALALALTSLPPDAREVVVLKVWGELSFVEIGAIVGSSGATVHRRFQEAVALLRRHLEPICNSPTTITTP